MAEIARNEYPPNDFVLSIQTSNEQMMAADRGGALKNVIHGMIKHELQMDNYYLPQTKTILVRVTVDTLDNPILKNW